MCSAPLLWVTRERIYHCSNLRRIQFSRYTSVVSAKYTLSAPAIFSFSLFLFISLSFLCSLLFGQIPFLVRFFVRSLHQLVKKRYIPKVALQATGERRGRARRERRGEEREREREKRDRTNPFYVLKLLVQQPAHRGEERR